MDADEILKRLDDPDTHVCIPAAEVLAQRWLELGEAVAARLPARAPWRLRLHRLLEERACHAVEAGKLEEVAALVMGMDPEEPEGVEALLGTAIGADNAEIVEWLLDHGGAVGGRCASKSVAMTQLLLARGAHTPQQLGEGLFVCDVPEVARALLDAGADRLVKDFEGKTPYEVFSGYVRGDLEWGTPETMARLPRHVAIADMLAPPGAPSAEALARVHVEERRLAAAKALTLARSERTKRRIRPPSLLKLAAFAGLLFEDKASLPTTYRWRVRALEKGRGFTELFRLKGNSLVEGSFYELFDEELAQLAEQSGLDPHQHHRGTLLLAAHDDQGALELKPDAVACLADLGLSLACQFASLERPPSILAALCDGTLGGRRMEREETLIVSVLDTSGSSSSSCEVARVHSEAAITDETEMIVEGEAAAEVRGLKAFDLRSLTRVCAAYSRNRVKPWPRASAFMLSEWRDGDGEMFVPHRLLVDLAAGGLGLHYLFND